MKVGPKSYRGIEFVCVDDLPLSQQVHLNNSPESPERIKILINNKITENCILYKDYEQWFHLIYKRAVVPTESPAKQSMENFPVRLVINET